jgi:anti-sigma factor RsiW
MNTTVTRDIILDLWPAYEAGESSPDTRAMVETYLAQDPEFAAVVRKVGAAVRGPAVPKPAPGEERRMVDATRRRLARQRWVTAAAVATTLTPAAFQFAPDQGPVFLYQTMPLIGLMLPVAAALWIWLWRMTRAQ